MSLEEIRGEDALRAEIERLHGLLEGKTRYVDCTCEGCPRMVPEAWLAGMCGPCSREDCEHDESAMAAAKAQGAAEEREAIVKLAREICVACPKIYRHLRSSHEETHTWQHQESHRR